MRILENRNSIDFPALYAAKVSLETYYLCEEALKLSVDTDCYTCPPQIKNTKRHDYFLRRIDEIYQSHQDLFYRNANIKT